MTTQGPAKRRRLGSVFYDLSVKREKVVELKCQRSLSVYRAWPYIRALEDPIWETVREHMHTYDSLKAIKAAFLVGLHTMSQDEFKTTDLLDFGGSCRALQKCEEGVRDLVSLRGTYPEISQARETVVRLYHEMRSYSTGLTFQRLYDAFYTGLREADTKNKNSAAAVDELQAELEEHLDQELSAGLRMRCVLFRCKCLLHHQIAKLGEAYRGACDDAQEMSALAHAQHSRGDCAAELRRLGYTRRCYICQEDAVFDMLRCPECGESVCASCVSQLARRFCAPDSPKHVRERSGGEVSCLACGHGTFALSTLRHRLDNETFEAVLLARDLFKAQVAVDAALHQERARRIAAEVGEGGGVDLAIHTANSLLTLACPHCGQAFAEITKGDCLALTCSRCSGHFCGWCTAAAATNMECHDHVRMCKWKPPHLNPDMPFYAGRHDWDSGTSAFRRWRLGEFLRALPSHVREEVQKRVGVAA